MVIPSTPGEPPFAFTSLNASHTCSLVMGYGLGFSPKFILSNRLILSWFNSKPDYVSPFAPS